MVVVGSSSDMPWSPSPKQVMSMRKVKGFSKVHKATTNLSKPLSGLFKNSSKSKSVVHTLVVLPKTCLTSSYKIIFSTCWPLEWHLRIIWRLHAQGCTKGCLYHQRSSYYQSFSTLLLLIIFCCTQIPQSLHRQCKSDTNMRSRVM